MTRFAGWVLPIVVGFVLIGVMVGASAPGDPGILFYISALLLFALAFAWLVAVVRLLSGSGRRPRQWIAVVAPPILTLVAFLLIHAGVPIQIRWYTAQPAFERALQAFNENATFGEHPGHIAGYPIEYISGRADNFVDFTYRDDQNGWNGFAYSADGNPPQTEHKSSGDYVIGWAKRLGPHWFAFQSYHTMH
ncbi:hypothetical protein [Mycolicibacterium sp. XJ775]|jgi:hypothetical protein